MLKFNAQHSFGAAQPGISSNVNDSTGPLSGWRGLYDMNSHWQDREDMVLDYYIPVCFPFCLCTQLYYMMLEESRIFQEWVETFPLCSTNIKLIRCLNSAMFFGTAQLKYQNDFTALF